MANLPAHISASWISLFLECPIAYRSRYIDKIDPFKGNIYTCFGKAVHAALEANYKQKVESKVDLPLKDCLVAFNAEFDKGMLEIGWDPSDVVEVMKMSGEEMLYSYLKEMAPKIQPAEIEMKFEIELKSVGRTLLWFIDLITADDVIVDHKTVGTTSRQKRTKCYVDNLPQLTVYAIAFRKLFNRIEKWHRIDVLKRLKGSVGFSQIESTRNDRDILALVNLVWKIKKIIEWDLWYPNLSHCSDCELSNICQRR